MTIDNADWVSKTDIIDYKRCPYRLDLCRKRGIPPISLQHSPLLDTIIKRGNIFESQINELVNPAQISLTDEFKKLKLPKYITEENGLVKNTKLGIMGKPDLWVKEDNLLLPVEIKSHKDIERTDYLELAFYSMLVTPRITGKAAYIITNSCDAIPIRVTLTPEIFEETMMLVYSVQGLKEEYNKPTPTHTSECKICELKEECLSSIKLSGDLSLISGIGYTYKRQLNDIGVNTIEQLSACNPETLDIDIKGRSPGYNRLANFVLSAQAWVGNSHIRLNGAETNIFDEDNFIMLDLEYDPYLWLIGILVVNNEEKTYHQFFADREIEVDKILSELGDVLTIYPDLPIITWSGTTADIPTLKRECGSVLVNCIISRHLDLCMITKASFVFPVVGYSLKELEPYFGYTRGEDNAIGNGGDAVAMYWEYCELSRNNARAKKIKRQLLEYNKQDLDGTLFVFNKIKELIHE